MKFLIFYIALSLTSLLAKPCFTKSQIENFQKAYNYGKNIKAKDGTTFEYALTGILYQESSGGSNNVDRRFDSIGPFQIRPCVAEELIKYNIPTLHYLLDNREELLNLLLNDFDFNLLLAGQHLRIYYNIALNRGMYKPWVKTVSRYNGGWHNYTYANKISNKINQLKRYKIIK